MSSYRDNDLIWRAADATENFNWIKKISDAFTAIGLPIETSVPGQIDLSAGTVALADSVGNYSAKPVGFQIRKMVAAGKRTIYIRIDYCNCKATSSYPTLAPSILIRLGSSVDNVGALGGPGWTIPIISGYGYYTSGENPPNSPVPLFMSSDGSNYFTILINPTCLGTAYVASTTPPLACVVERSISDSTLDYDNDAIVVVAPNFNAPSFTGIASLSSPAVFSIRDYRSSNLIYEPNYVPAQTPAGLSSSKIPGQTLLFPVTVCTPLLKKPMRNILYYFKNDIAGGMELQTSYYGQTANFITCGTYMPGTTSPNASNYSFAIRF